MQVQGASRWYFAATATAVFVLLIFMTPWSPQLPAPEKDVWRIHPRVKFDEGSNERSSASQSITVHLYFDGKDVQLDLVENELLKTSPPVFLSENNGNITRVNFDKKDIQKPKYLQDKNGRAAVMLLTNATHESGASHEIDGILVYDKETYQISPIRDTTHESNNWSAFTHEVKKLSPQETADNALGAAIEQLSKVNQHDALRPLARIRRTALPAYEVQLLYVIDYSTYRKFRKGLSLDGKQANKSTIVWRMLTYFAHISNLVDFRYKNIKTAPFTIRTKLTSIYIVTRGTASNWTESHHMHVRCNGVIQKSDLKSVKSDKVLAAFKKWIYGASGAVLRASLPSFDHAVLFTSYDMCSPYGFGHILGIAYVNSMCKRKSTSIVKHDKAAYDAEAAAHELGHSLGASHDGTNNVCNSSTKYVMTNVVEYRTSRAFQLRNLFSNCSIEYFTNFILSLKNNCLTDTETHFYPQDLPFHLNMVPGQAFSPDVLCREFFGASFRACGGTEYGSKVCTELRCYNASQPVSNTVNCPFRGARVLDGTSCGNKRWCEDGKCVYNSLAPEAFDDCPIGDLAENFQVRPDERFVCSDMPTSYCNSQDVYSACCGRCSMLTNNTKPECESGDHSGKIGCTSSTL